MPRLDVEVQGLPALLEKLAPRWLYFEIMKGQLDALGAEAAAAARSSAGSFVRTGTLVGGIQHKVNSVPAPLWVVVTTNATSRTGRRYPWILEFGAKWGHKNWLLGAIKRAQGGAERAVAAAASQIEAKWGS